MPSLPPRLSKKILFVLRFFILLMLILGTVDSSAQISKSELKKLQKESSFKIITLKVEGIKTVEQAIDLKAKLTSIRDVKDCEVDYVHNSCKIVAGFSVQKSDIIDITAPTGVKTSNYSEEIFWRSTQNSDKKIKSTDEKERAREVYSSMKAEQRISHGSLKENKDADIQKKELQDHKGHISPINDSLSNPSNGYPSYIKTGSKVGDDKAYRAAKDEWIKNNPEKYRQKSKGTNQSLTKISSQAFEKMSIKEQNRIKNNPDKFIITK